MGLSRGYAGSYPALSYTRMATRAAAATMLTPTMVVEEAEAAVSMPIVVVVVAVDSMHESHITGHFSVTASPTNKSLHFPT